MASQLISSKKKQFCAISCICNTIKEVVEGYLKDSLPVFNPYIFCCEKTTFTYNENNTYSKKNIR